MSEPPQEDPKSPFDALVHRGPQHAAPYPQSRMAPAFDAAVAAQDLAQDLARAEHMLGAVARGKLDLLVEQIQHLQAQAQRIVDEAKQDLDLHRAECRFAREVDGIYHLYAREDGTRYFSLLSPEDWGVKMPHAFVGSFRLLADMRYAALDAPSRPQDE